MFDDLFSMDGKYARFMNGLWNILELSILWLVCCLPVITIGAASTAAYYTASKVIRHKTGRVASEFFGSFRRNFLQSLPLLVCFGGVFILVFVECLYLFSEPAIPAVLLYAFYGMLLALLACMDYLWACLSRFCLASFAFARMSATLVFRHLITTIALLLINLAMVVGVFLMPWGVLLFPGVKYALEAVILDPILLQYAPEVSEDDPEAQKWYYQ